MQVRGLPGDALQGQERQRWMPLVPVPELLTDIQMEVHLDGSVPPIWPFSEILHT
jgi:hypothetical protein